MAVFSIDVETMGLYGECFAVGVSVIDNIGSEIEAIYLRADHSGYPPNQWIEENVIPHLDPVNCSSVRELRDKFWAFYLRCKQTYPDLIIIGDCSSPCESGFFRQCVMDNIAERQWVAPYPLHELGTLLLAGGENPIGTFERKPNELPKHHPLADARQSARLWFECSRYLNGCRAVKL